MDRPKLTASQLLKSHRKVRATAIQLFDLGYCVTVAEGPSRAGFRFPTILARIDKADLVKCAEEIHALIPTFADGPWVATTQFHPHDGVALLELTGCSPPASEIPPIDPT